MRRSVVIKAVVDVRVIGGILLDVVSASLLCRRRFLGKAVPATHTSAEGQAAKAPIS